MVLEHQSGPSRLCYLLLVYNSIALTNLMPAYNLKTDCHFQNVYASNAAVADIFDKNFPPDFLPESRLSIDPTVRQM